MQNHLNFSWIFDFCSCFLDIHRSIKHWRPCRLSFKNFVKWTLLSKLFSFFSKQITFLVSVFWESLPDIRTDFGCFNWFWLFLINILSKVILTNFIHFLIKMFLLVSKAEAAICHFFWILITIKACWIGGD